MAKRPDLTSHQRKIVNRYYEHLDTIAITKLQEAVGELFLLQGDPSKAKAADRLWKSVETALAKTSASDTSVRTIVEKRDVKALAELLSRLR
jgi:hypothetical protein